MIVCAIGWLAFEVPRGILTNTDELFTAERSREMLLLGRSVVHFNFEPSFSKPPLQYWLTSFTLLRIMNSALAVRVWPLLFGALTAMAFAWLIFLLEPNRPWLVPIGVAILISSPLFLTEVCRALLDSGLMFFATLSIVFTQLARTRPVWWLGVAVAAWLGMLQKIPLIFLIWAIIIAVRISSPTQRSSLRSFWLPVSVALAVLLVCTWPAIQFFKFHRSISEITGLNELTARVHNVADRPYLEIPLRMNLAWIGFGTIALVAPVVLLFRITKTEASRELSILCLVLIGSAIVFNLRSVRYLVPIVPCLCVLTALLLQSLLDRSRRIRIGVVIVAVLFFVVDVVEAKLKIDSRRKDAADEQLVAEKLGAIQRPGVKTAIIGAGESNGVLYQSFYLFHGNLHYPVASCSSVQGGRDLPDAPAVGVCASRELPLLREKYRNLVVVFERGPFICWRAD